MTKYINFKMCNTYVESLAINSLPKNVTLIILKYKIMIDDKKNN
jgi:hypothetical protein